MDNTVMLKIEEELKNFMDSGKRLNIYPSKKKYKILSLFYFASKFEKGKKYTEKEVNETLKLWHNFSDWAMIRRELYDKFFMDRFPDCTCYWLEEKQPDFSDFGIEI